VSFDRNATVRAVLLPTILVAGCSRRFVGVCVRAAAAVRCDVREARLDEFSTSVATCRPLAIVLQKAEYDARRAEYDERAQDVAACVVPVLEDRVDEYELEGLFMAAVAEAHRRRAT
jgi:hypothetical protein